MGKFKIYDVIQKSGLVQIELQLIDIHGLVNLFDRLDKREIKIKFLALQKGKNDFYCLSFCIERSDLLCLQKIIRQMCFKRGQWNIVADAGLVAIYGPHFAEKPGIIEAMHSCLSAQKVKVLSISTTVSTSFFVIPAAEVVQAVDILKQAFEIPHGRD